MLVLQTNTNQIPKKAYLGENKLTEAMLPYGVTELSDWAFAGCKNLELIALPDTIKEIGKDVFLNCTGLKRILIFGKEQEETLQEGGVPLWNTTESIEGELLMQAVCWLLMPQAIPLFSTDRTQFFKELREQITGYLARPDEEGFAPFLAGGEEDYDDRESDPAYYCRRQRLKKVMLLSRYLLLADSIVQECMLERSEKEQWIAYMKEHEESYQIFLEEQHLVRELFALYEKLNLFDRESVSALLEQVTGQQVELRALLLRKQEEYVQTENGWGRYEL